MPDTRRIERVLWLAMAGLAVLFVAVPEIDLAVSRAVYRGDGTFLLHDDAATRTYDVLRSAVATGFAVLMLAAVVADLAGRQLWVLTPRKTVAVLLSAAIAPGLIANLVLKEQFGRARPKHIVEFGGTREFSPAWIPTDQCTGNCSFVSGDVAFAFLGLALALCCTRGRGAAVAAAIAFGLAVAAMRVLQGAHFASDAIFGGLITVLTVLIVHRVVAAPGGPAGPAWRAPGGWLDTWPAQVRGLWRGRA